MAHSSNAVSDDPTSRSSGCSHVPELNRTPDDLQLHVCHMGSGVKLGIPKQCFIKAFEQFLVLEIYRHPFAQAVIL